MTDNTGKRVFEKIDISIEKTTGLYNKIGANVGKSDINFAHRLPVRN